MITKISTNGRSDISMPPSPPNGEAPWAKAGEINIGKILERRRHGGRLSGPMPARSNSRGL